VGRCRLQAGRFLLAASLAVILLATLWPVDADTDDDGDVTPPPPFFCLACADRGTADVLANLILFLPLGAGLALAGATPHRATALTVAFTTAIEVLQHRVIPGRDGAFDDILANSLGGLLGMGLVLAGPLLLRPGRGWVARLRAGALMAPVLVMSATAWLWEPDFPATTWYGQWAPDLGVYEQFRGRVLAAQIGGADLPPWRLDDSDARRGRLEAAGTLTLRARFTVPVATGRVAPITAVFDEQEQRIVFLGQDGLALRFEARTRAEAFGFRSPSVVLRDAVVVGDTVPQEAVGTLRRGILSVEGSAVAGGHRRFRALSPAMGWALVSPFDLQNEWVVRILSVVWMAALWLAWGYYARLGSPRTRTVALLAPSAAAVGIAAAFGPVAVPWAELAGGWMGTLLGLAAASAVLRSRPSGPSPRSAPLPPSD
jgi:hypothetical protein